FLIMEGDRFQPENSFARLLHRFDRLLETRRGGCRAKLTGGVYLNGRACNCRPIDAGNKGFGLCSGRADANRPGFASNASVANIDIVAASGKIPTCGNTQRDVAATARVINERVNPVGSVPTPRSSDLQTYIHTVPLFFVAAHGTMFTGL